MTPGLDKDTANCCKKLPGTSKHFSFTNLQDLDARSKPLFQEVKRSIVGWMAPRMELSTWFLTVLITFLTARRCSIFCQDTILLLLTVCDWHESAVVCLSEHMHL